jgi:hypothetical protein
MSGAEQYSSRNEGRGEVPPIDEEELSALIASARESFQDKDEPKQTATDLLAPELDRVQFAPELGTELKFNYFCLLSRCLTSLSLHRSAADALELAINAARTHSPNEEPADRLSIAGMLSVKGQLYLAGRCYKEAIVSLEKAKSSFPVISQHSWGSDSSLDVALLTLSIDLCSAYLLDGRSDDHGRELTSLLKNISLVDDATRQEIATRVLLLARNILTAGMDREALELCSAAVADAPSTVDPEDGPVRELYAFQFATSLAEEDLDGALAAAADYFFVIDRGPREVQSEGIAKAVSFVSLLRKMGYPRSAAKLGRERLWLLKERGFKGEDVAPLMLEAADSCIESCQFSLATDLLGELLTLPNSSEVLVASANLSVLNISRIKSGNLEQSRATAQAIHALAAKLHDQFTVNRSLEDDGVSTAAATASVVVRAKLLAVESILAVTNGTARVNDLIASIGHHLDELPYDSLWETKAMMYAFRALTSSARGEWSNFYDDCAFAISSSEEISEGVISAAMLTPHIYQARVLVELGKPSEALQTLETALNTFGFERALSQWDLRLHPILSELHRVFGLLGARGRVADIANIINQLNREVREGERL